MFVEKLKTKITNLPYGGKARNLLKVVLGEIQQQSAVRAVTDEQCYSIVKNMINANVGNLKFLKDDDPRTEQYLNENAVLNDLLPKYWSEQDIRNWLQDEKIDVNSFPNTGAVMGFCMQKLKGEPVEGSTVRKIIEELRNS